MDTNRSMPSCRCEDPARPRNSSAGRPTNLVGAFLATDKEVTRYVGQLTGEDKDQQLTLDHLANAS
ncbi:MAG: hypothetical protein WCG85_17655, partial [Polyangia bacterium]